MSRIVITLIGMVLFLVVVVGCGDGSSGEEDLHRGWCEVAWDEIGRDMQKELPFPESKDDYIKECISEFPKK